MGHFVQIPQGCWRERTAVTTRFLSTFPMPLRQWARCAGAQLVAQRGVGLKTEPGNGPQMVRPYQLRQP